MVIDRCRDSIKIIIVPAIIVQRLGTIYKKKTVPVRPVLNLYFRLLLLTVV